MVVRRPFRLPPAAGPDGRNPLDSGLWKLRLALPAPPRDTKRAANEPRAVI